eukprot:gene9757-11394_t
MGTGAYWAIAITTALVVIGGSLLGVAYFQPQPLVRLLSRHYGDEVIFYADNVDPTNKVVALTIDDGPSTETEEILDILAQYGAHATFFLIGRNIERTPRAPEILDRMLAEGNELGNHMWRDEPSINLEPVEFERQLLQVDRMINSTYTGRQKHWHRKLFRPGSGFFNRDMIKTIQRNDYTMCLGNVYPHDPFIKNHNVNSWYVTATVTPGSVIILHDREHTLPALRTILPRLIADGYNITTISKLLEVSQKEKQQIPISAIESSKTKFKSSTSKKQRTITGETRSLEFTSISSTTKPQEQVFPMKQSVIGYQESFEKEGKEPKVYMDKVKALSSSFGSKITRKLIQKIEGENLGSLDQEKTKKMAEKAQNKLVEDVQEDTTADLPRFNGDTTEVKEAYPIEDLLPQAVYFALEPQAYIGYAKDITTIPDDMPQYFQTRIIRVLGGDKASAHDKDDDDVEHECKIILYMYYLYIMIKESKSREIVQALDKAGIPKDVSKHMLNTFAFMVSKNRYNVSRECKSVLLNYIAILSLHIENFIVMESTIAKLASILYVDDSTLEKHYTRIGCKIVKSSGEKGFKLTVPLKHPELARTKNDRKK